MKTRIFSLILALLMLLSMGSCGSEETSKEQDAKQTEADTEIVTEEDKDEETEALEETEEEDPKESEKIDLSFDFSVEHIKTVDIKVDSIGNQKGVYYEEDGYTGIMSFDGEKITDAKYNHSSFSGKDFDLFSVGIKKKEITEPTDYNYYGVIDVNGETILPLKYAKIDFLNDRYIRAYTITGETDNRDEAILYEGSIYNQMGNMPEGAKMFKGKWEVFDAIERKFVEGVNSNEAGNVETHGNDIISYKNKNGETIYINHKGKRLPDKISFYYDNYAVDEGGVQTLYTSEGKKLFQVDKGNGDYLRAFSICDGETENYMLYDNTAKEYYFINEKGERISEAISDNRSFSYYNGIVLGTGTYDFYSLDGEFLTGSKSGDRIKSDTVTNKIWSVKNKENYKVFSSEGQIILDIPVSDDLITDYSMMPYIKTDTGRKYYMIKDGKVTLSEASNCIGNWLLVIRNDDKTTLINSLNGEEIIEMTGIVKFLYATDTDTNTTYIYGITENGTEIYKMTNK